MNWYRVVLPDPKKLRIVDHAKLASDADARAWAASNWAARGGYVEILVPPGAAWETARWVRI